MFGLRHINFPSPSAEPLYVGHAPEVPEMSQYVHMFGASIHAFTNTA